MKYKLVNICKLKKHFKKGLTPLLCALTVFNFCVGSASAYNADVRITEPYVSDTQSYVAVRITSASGNSFVRVFIINYYYAQNSNDPNGFAWVQDLASSVSTGMSFDDTNGDGIPNNLHLSFTSRIPCNVSVFEYSSDTDNLVLKYNSHLDDGINYGVDCSTGSNFTAFTYKGKYSYVNMNNFILSKDLAINWGSEININSILNNINTSILNMNANLGNLSYQQNQNLIKIYDRLGELISNESTGSVQDVSSSEINSVENKENALVGSNVSTNELSVDINPVASAVVWNLVDNVVTGNAKVFTMFISILTIAVIGLILNR